MNSKEEQTNSEVTHLENESLIEEQKDPNQINEQIEDNKLDEKTIEIKDEYKFSENPSLNLIEIGMSTKANLFIAPIQDILCLDDSSRLNIPGTKENNWKWKLNRPLEEIEDNIRIFSELGNNYGRIRK